MRKLFINVPSWVLFISLIIACNNNSTNKLPSNDSMIVINEPVRQMAIANESDSDYTKRKINLSQMEWTAYKKAYKVSGLFTQGNNKIIGDFNGDGKKETLFMVPPVEDTLTKDAFQNCLGGCNSYLVSSDTAMMVLKVVNNLGGEIKNIGDIDGDGAADIMVYPSWWQSNWNAYNIYSMNKTNQQWSYLIEPITIFANELEKNIFFVKKTNRQGYISAYNTTTDEAGNFHSGYKDYKITK